jgi:hypothetical protein
MSADQSLQTISIDAYEQIDSTCSLSQIIQSVSVDSFFNHQSAIQAIQSLNAQAFTQINATISAIQGAQSVAINAWYYDIGIDANIVQPQQSTQSVGFISLSLEASVSQPMQYMAASSTTAVITAPSPIVVMTRDRILRNIRNRGSR